MKYIFYVFLLLFSVFILGLLFRGCSVANDAADVTVEQFGPRSALIKYEWFKNASEALKAKEKTISIYEESLSLMDKQYSGTPKKDWPRDEREAYNQKSVELSGIKASYNSLVAEYNANSQKFNWSFANTEDNLPKAYQEKK